MVWIDAVCVCAPVCTQMDGNRGRGEHVGEGWSQSDRVWSLGGECREEEIDDVDRW